MIPLINDCDGQAAFRSLHRRLRKAVGNKHNFHADKEVETVGYTDWMIRTKQIGTCSCDYGCPCEFNAPPTRLPCEGVMAMEITEGHYGDVSLDGLRTAGAYRWPGAVHDGNGTWWSVIDRRASKEQVDALFTILGGQDQEPTTGFAIYASTIAHEPDPTNLRQRRSANRSPRPRRCSGRDVLAPGLREGAAGLERIGRRAISPACC